MTKPFLLIFVLSFSFVGIFDFHGISAEEAGGAITVGTCVLGQCASIYGDIITFLNASDYALVYYNISTGGAPIDTGVYAGGYYSAVYEDTITFLVWFSAEMGFYDISTGISTYVTHPLGYPFDSYDFFLWAFYFPSRVLSVYGDVVAFYDCTGIWYYNIATGNFTQIADVGEGVSVYGGIIAFSEGGVIKYYNTTTGVTTNTGLTGTCPSIGGNIIAYRSGSAIVYYNLTSETATNTGQMGEGPYVYGRGGPYATIAYSTSDIIMMYDVFTENVTDTGETGIAPSVGSRGIVFVTPDTEHWTVKYLPCNCRWLDSLIHTKAHLKIMW